MRITVLACATPAPASSMARTAAALKGVIARVFLFDIPIWLMGQR
jgi:hypothetical protein